HARSKGIVVYPHPRYEMAPSFRCDFLDGGAKQAEVEVRPLRLPRKHVTLLVAIRADADDRQLTQALEEEGDRRLARDDRVDLFRGGLGRNHVPQRKVDQRGVSLTGQTIPVVDAMR